MQEVASTLSTSTGGLVVDFGAPREATSWTGIDDTVMGGLSESRFTATEYDTCLFTGNVSLDNNGGFASVRRPLAPGIMRGATEVHLFACGDGRDYKLRFQTDGKFEDASYEVVFSTKARIWQTLSFPIEAFRPVWRGRPVPQAGPLDPAKIRSMGLMISGKQAGPFELEISALSASTGS